MLADLPAHPFDGGFGERRPLVLRHGDPQGALPDDPNLPCTGSIMILPSCTVIRRVIPGRIPASSRTALGRTNRPAESMVVWMAFFMAERLP
jgi:hypothetical protein